MPTFDYYNDILVPIKTRLDGDPRFGGKGVNVFYDRTEERQVPTDLMPAINYFLLSPWDDTSIGVGNFSIRNRKFTVRVGLIIWVFNDDPEKIDMALSTLGGDLYDLLREHERWDNSKQILIGKEIPMDIDFPVSADGTMVGAQMFSVTFDQWTG